MPDPIPRPAGCCAIDTDFGTTANRFLFYVDSNNHIVYYKLDATDLANNPASYVYQNVITERGAPVEVYSETIAGLAYLKNEVRIYYVKYMENPNRRMGLYVREALGLLSDDGSTISWLPGHINHNNFIDNLETVPNTFITALVDQSNNCPWVMFTSGDGGRFRGTRAGHIRPNNDTAENAPLEMWNSAIIQLHGGP